VIEVGVGGRLDPTRAIAHETAVLARIGLDHEAILGSTLEAIAREKLAISEGAARMVYMKPDESLRGVFAEFGTGGVGAAGAGAGAGAGRGSCEFIEARTFQSRVVLTGGVPQWHLLTPWGEAPLALMGERAASNTSLALEVMNVLGEPIDLSRLASVVWPGRMERVSVAGRDVYLSGDHNEQGVESLRELLAHFDYERLWLVVGIGKGKPAEQMLAQYRRVPRAELILTKTYFRQIDSAEFAALDAAVKIDDAFEALEFAASKAGPRDLVVVSGSLYLVGDLKARLLRD
jgi:dihydrofolate synthase/folylpolyglutamate synthase